MAGKVTVIAYHGAKPGQELTGAHEPIASHPVIVAIPGNEALDAGFEGG